LAVAALDVAPVVRSDRRLELEDAIGPRGGVVEAREREHAADVAAVGIANRLEALVAVEALVGQPDAVLLEEDDVALRVARVVVDEQLVEAARALALQLADRREQLRDGCHGLRP